MRISLIGGGYVSLVAAAALASIGRGVIAVDVDEARISAINSKKSHIFGQGLAHRDTDRRER